MKSRNQIYLQVIEEMPYASEAEVSEEVDIRINEHYERTERHNNDATQENMHYPDAYGTGSIFDY